MADDVSSVLVPSAPVVSSRHSRLLRIDDERCTRIHGVKLSDRQPE